MSGRADDFAPVFYVYTLSDPRNGAVFYVGKGKGQRMHQHLALSLRGDNQSNPGKHQRILDIVAAGLLPIASIVARYDHETDAYEHEEELVAATPGLTNILPGGWCGWALPPGEAARRAAARVERITRERTIERHSRRVARLKGWLRCVDGWPHGATFPDLPGGDQQAAEFVALVRSMAAAL